MLRRPYNARILQPVFDQDYGGVKNSNAAFGKIIAGHQANWPTLAGGASGARLFIGLMSVRLNED